MVLTPKQQAFNLLCFLFGHKITQTEDRDMFGYKYVWQREYCERCGKTLY